MSNGVDLDARVTGYAATRIVGAYHVGQTGGEYMRVPANPADNNLFMNSLFVSRCIYVDFRLGAVLAEGYALAKVWVKEPRPHPALSKMVESVYLVTPKDTGKVAGHYQYRHFGVQNRKLQEASLRERAVARAAAVFNAPVKRLVVERMRVEGPVRLRKRPRAGASNLFMKLP